jgi:hypothetical protein
VEIFSPPEIMMSLDRSFSSIYLYINLIDIDLYCIYQCILTILLCLYTIIIMIMIMITKTTIRETAAVGSGNDNDDNDNDYNENKK